MSRLLLILLPIAVTGCIMPNFRYETHLPEGPISDYIGKYLFLTEDDDVVAANVQKIVLTQCIDSDQSLEKCSMSCLDDKCTYYGYFKFIPISKEVNQIHGKLGIIAYEVVFYKSTKSVMVNKREI